MEHQTQAGLKASLLISSSRGRAPRPRATHDGCLLRAAEMFTFTAVTSKVLWRMSWISFSNVMPKANMEADTELLVMIAS